MTLPTDLAILVAEVEAAGFPRPIPEHRFHPTRKWRFDLFYEGYGVAVEREGIGGSHPQGIGRHQTRTGLRNDAEKYNEAAILGIYVLRFTSSMLLDGTAKDQLIRALESRDRQ